MVLRQWLWQLHSTHTHAQLTIATSFKYVGESQSRICSLNFVFAEVTNHAGYEVCKCSTRLATQVATALAFALAVANDPEAVALAAA